MTANDIIKRAKDLASCKTLYVKGCPCLALNQRAKLKYSNTYENSKRASKIFAASDDTVGLDEITMFEYIFPEGKFKNVGAIMDHCHDISKDFKTIIPGEIVFMQERVGIYIGDGKVITCSLAGVGETILDGWVSHGKMMFVDYVDNELVKIAEEVIKNAESEESNVEVRPDSTWSGDRVQSLPPQNKGHHGGHGRHGYSHMSEMRTGNDNRAVSSQPNEGRSE